jgi:hypothetical protein
MARTYIPQKTETLSLRIRPEIKKVIEKQAAWENKSVSAYAEECLEDILRKRGLLK